MKSLRAVIRAWSFALFVLALSITARASEWQRGDVFVAIGNGQYQVYRDMGGDAGYSRIETITDGSGTISGENGTGGSGYTGGCAFDSTSHLYTLNFSNANVYKYFVPDRHMVSKTIGPSSGASSSESIVFDGQGNFFVGHADGSHVVDKFDPTGKLVQSFNVAIENRGSDHIELSADGNTLYYTSEGTHVKTFDLVSGTQGSDLINLPQTAFSLRLLPSTFGTFAGDLLVADSGSVERISFSDGAFIAQTYTVPGQATLFTLSLDTDGTSFWVGDLGTGEFFRINISSGSIEVGPIATGAIPNVTDKASLGGICVNGLATAAQPQPVVQTLTLGPPRRATPERSPMTAAVTHGR